ncbi:MAG: EAL domain-containing protein [Campylobacterales bacterium]|nr:EAL domain-containing protein [Campylobacterales bacterium]
MTLPDKRLATAFVLVNALNQMGLRSLVGDAMVFINIDAKFLLTDIIYTIPKERFVLELNEDIQISQKEYECIKALHKSGYTFALDNARLDQAYSDNIRRVLPYVAYVKFDTTEIDHDDPEVKLELYTKTKS